MNHDVIFSFPRGVGKRVRKREANFMRKGGGMGRSFNERSMYECKTTSGMKIGERAWLVCIYVWVCVSW